MRHLILAALITIGSASAFAQGRFYVGGSWGFGTPAPMRAYGPPPPPPRVYYGGYGYARPMAPGPGYMWVDGYYDYFGRDYRWRPGYWARRPHPRAVWVAPRYNRGFYVSGYWRR